MRANTPDTVVIMAGGEGRRLAPLTDSKPKPMLQVGGKPILEHVLGSCIDSGLRKFIVVIRYLGSQIQEYFGDGSRWGVELTYIVEQEALGTAGALSLIPFRPEDSFLVMNGDVLVSDNFRALLKFHVLEQADVTVATARYESVIPYGVVDMKERYVVRVDEKPSFSFTVNAGVYVVRGEMFETIKRGERVDFTDFLNALLTDASRRVVAFPLEGGWIDVGDRESLQRAVSLYQGSSSIVSLAAN